MKEQLQTKVNELELTLNSLELNAKVVRDDLKEANKKLESASKPIITKDLLEQIQYVIDESIRNSSLSSVDSYDVDFEIDYNNSLALGSIEFNDADQLSEEIADGIENIFNIIEN
jgi:hypothetical protein|tara:strand:- start:357 stop:701 length:345 start_codon:yes stop_codon:yes gene_type:complete